MISLFSHSLFDSRGIQSFKKDIETANVQGRIYDNAKTMPLNVIQNVFSANLER